MKAEYCRYMANVTEIAAIISKKYGEKIALDVSYSSKCGCFAVFVAKGGKSPFSDDAIFQKNIFFNYPDEDIIASFEEMQEYLISLLS